MDRMPSDEGDYNLHVRKCPMLLLGAASRAYANKLLYLGARGKAVGKSPLRNT